MIASEYIYTKMSCWSWNLFNGSTDNFRVYWDELAYLRTMDPYLQTGDVLKGYEEGGDSDAGRLYCSWRLVFDTSKFRVIQGEAIHEVGKRC